MVLEKTPESPLDCKEIKLKEISPNVHWKDWCWSWNSNTLATWFEELTPWKRPWCWERLKAGREEDARGWDGWMASLTQRIWVWASSGSWWRAVRPGVLQSMGSQRVGHDWATELNCTLRSNTSQIDWYQSLLPIRWNSKNCLLKKVKNLPNFLIIPMHPCVLSRFSHVRLFVTPWTVAHQAPLSMGFSRQEYWSGLPCPPPGDLPDSGIEPESLMSPALAGRFFTTSATWEAHNTHNRPQIQSWYSLPPLPSPLAKCRIQGTFSEHNIIKWKQLFL